jgi:hypothetical protein
MRSLRKMPGHGRLNFDERFQRTTREQTPIPAADRADAASAMVHRLFSVLDFHGRLVQFDASHDQFKR